MHNNESIICANCGRHTNSIPAAGTIAFEQIVKAITFDVTGFSPELIYNTRKREIVETRWYICAVLRNYTTYSLNEIARALGLEDHSTVIYALKEHEGQISVNKIYRNTFEEIEARISKIWRMLYPQSSSKVVARNLEPEALGEHWSEIDYLIKAYCLY